MSVSGSVGVPEAFGVVRDTGGRLLLREFGSALRHQVAFLLASVTDPFFGFICAIRGKMSFFLAFEAGGVHFYNPID